MFHVEYAVNCWWYLSLQCLCSGTWQPFLTGMGGRYRACCMLNISCVSFCIFIMYCNTILNISCIIYSVYPLLSLYWNYCHSCIHLTFSEEWVNESKSRCCTESRIKIFVYLSPAWRKIHKFMKIQICDMSPPWRIANESSGRCCMYRIRQSRLAWRSGEA